MDRFRLSAASSVYLSLPHLAESHGSSLKASETTSGHCLKVGSGSYSLTRARARLGGLLGLFLEAPLPKQDTEW